MFKISVVETDSRRRLVLEGTLIDPWTGEVEQTWQSAREQLEGRTLTIDVRNVTLISREGENTLLNMMRKGAKFSGGNLLTRHVLRQLARKCRCAT
jgi:hypothetical protein